MAETYEVTLAIEVVEEKTRKVIAEEKFYFSEQTFAKMANIADQFYELITKLQKAK